MGFGVGDNLLLKSSIANISICFLATKVFVVKFSLSPNQEIMNSIVSESTARRGARNPN
jgi:hypothetical protein